MRAPHSAPNRPAAPPASPHTPETAELMRLTLLFSFGGDQRNPQLLVQRKLHALGHHTYDGGRHIVDAHRPAQKPRIGAVAVAPNAVAEDRHRLGVRLI